jgi:hypothetical protein
MMPGFAVLPFHKNDDKYAIILSRPIIATDFVDLPVAVSLFD